MAILLIRRPAENSIRPYDIYIDNERMGQVENGEQKEFRLAEGLHKLQAKVDFMCSRVHEINIGDDEVIEFSLSGYKRPKWVTPLFVMILVVNILARIYQYRNPMLFWLLFLPLVLLIIDVVARKNNFLKLLRM